MMRDTDGRDVRGTGREAGPTTPVPARRERRVARPGIRSLGLLLGAVLVAALVVWGIVWWVTADAISESRSLVSAGEPGAARAKLELALLARPGDRGLLVELARVTAATGDVDRAVAAYRGALAAGPDAAISYELAMVERLAGRAADAGSDFALAAAGDSKNVTYADEHAKTLLELGRRDQALGVWRRLASDTSRPAAVRGEMRLRVARALLDSGDLAGARTEIIAALELVPGDPVATAMLETVK